VALLTVVVGLAAMALALVPLALGHHRAAALPMLFDGTTSVYRVPLAGGPPERVLRLHGQWEFPVTTDDGRALLLERPEAARTSVWRVPLDGSARVLVRTLPRFTQPPMRNGGYTAVEEETQAAAGWRIDLVVRDARGHVVWRRAMPFPLAPVSPAPDGHRVAAARLRRLELVTPRASKLLAADASQFVAPLWSRDARSLLYWNTKQQLVAIDVATGSTRVLLRGRYFEYALSRNGRSVYVLGRNDAVSIPK
jgi:hypothetical protein